MKKAWVQDWIFFGIFMLILFIGILVGSNIISSINTNVQKMDNSTIGAETINNFEHRFAAIFDGIFIVIFVLFGIAVFVSMFLMDSHPAAFFFVVIIFAFILIVLAIFGNVFDSMTEDGPLAEEAAKFGIMTWVTENWTLMLTVFGFISLILFFSKIRSGWFGV